MALYRYAYDEENRLIAVTRKSDNRVVGQYQYDALSRRVMKIADPFPVSSPVETRYFYDDARIIEEQNAARRDRRRPTSMATTLTKSSPWIAAADLLLPPEQPVVGGGDHRRTANVVERYAYDAYGLPMIFDGAGAPVPANPWGTPHSAIGNPWMFTGTAVR